MRGTRVRYETERSSPTEPMFITVRTFKIGDTVQSFNRRSKLFRQTIITYLDQKDRSEYGCYELLETLLPILVNHLRVSPVNVGCGHTGSPRVPGVLDEGVPLLIIGRENSETLTSITPTQDFSTKV